MGQQKKKRNLRAEYKKTKAYLKDSFDKVMERKEGKK